MILAGRIGNEVVIANDRRIYFAQVGKTAQVGEADKLFIVHTSAIASFGTSPPNTDAHAMIRSLGDNNYFPVADLAAELLLFRTQQLIDCGALVFCYWAENPKMVHFDFLK